MMKTDDEAGKIKAYDFEQNQPRELGPGKSPTWSPDGEWIAYLDHDTYYAMRPDGKEKNPLFRKKHAFGALWWSPDSRLVSYSTVTAVLDGQYSRLYVRRLSDNSDVRVAKPDFVGEYQWVTNSKLLSQAQPKLGHK